MNEKVLQYILDKLVKIGKNYVCNLNYVVKINIKKIKVMIISTGRKIHEHCSKSVKLAEEEQFIYLSCTLTYKS